MRLDPGITSKELATLREEFGEKLSELSGRLLTSSIRIYAFSTLRGPLAQARMWCASRSEAEVVSRIGLLQGAYAPRLASLLKPEFACCGRPTTQSLPGLSWHQWGEAADIVVDVGGITVWDGELYSEILAQSKALGLTHSRNWKAGTGVSGMDNQHIQLRKSRSPLENPRPLTWWEVEERMTEMYEI